MPMTIQERMQQIEAEFATLQQQEASFKESLQQNQARQLELRGAFQALQSLVADEEKPVTEKKEKSQAKKK